MTRQTLIVLIMLPILLSVYILESPVIAASHPPYRLTQIHSTSEPKFLLKAANRLYFKPDGETNYWVTDGLPENTHAISEASFCTLSNWSQHHDGHPTAIGNVAYFPGPDCELWRTDGTANGTFRLSQGAFPLNYVDSGIVGETAFGNKLVFLTGDDIFVEWSQYSLWGSDGTQAGTKKIASLNETGASMKYISPVALLNVVYFFTIHSSNTDSNIRWVKFWQSDGTENGTKIIFDSRTFTDFTGMPEKLVASSSHVFFTSRNADYSQDLWQSDGTLPGTEMVAPIGFGEVTDMVDADGTVFMINRKYSDQTGTLYSTRGKELGGLQTVYIFPQPLSSSTMSD